MATVAISGNGHTRSHSLICTWATPMAATDVTVPFQAQFVESAAIRVSGTFDSATLVVQGSTDGVTYQTLHDNEGNDLSFTSARTESIAECEMPFIRCSTSGGGGSTAIVPVIIANQRGV